LHFQLAKSPIIGDKMRYFLPQKHGRTANPQAGGMGALWQKYSIQYNSTSLIISKKEIGCSIESMSRQTKHSLKHLSN